MRKTDTKFGLVSFRFYFGLTLPSVYRFLDFTAGWAFPKAGIE